VRTGGAGALATALAALGIAAQQRGTGAMAAAQATPGATPGAENPDALEIDGAWLCNQPFALCTTAPCELSPSDATIANCRCFVMNGHAIGFKSCSERAMSGSSVTSNFSTVNVTSAFQTMTCPKEIAWANCLDMPCEINPRNPAEASCQCQVVDTGPSLTFGGGCDTSTCTSVIWSAAPVGLLGLEQYESGMQQLDQTVTLPVTCPSATPVA
jgi:hypothetical protein